MVYNSSKIFFIFLLIHISLSGQNINSIVIHDLDIFDIQSFNDEQIDIGFWALVIAKGFDPQIDIEKYLNQLDSMVNEINRMLAGREKDMDKFLATKMYLYDSGVWNGHKSYSYDLSDPLGKNLHNQLLTSYLDKRKGNCVSMPTLFLALMERIDSTIIFNGIKAPQHLFCRFHDRQTYDIWNIETTNGGNPARNQWYINEMGIGEKAITNNLYLRDLTKKEYIAELIGVLITWERRNGNFEKAMEYTDLVIKLSPNSDLGLVNKGALIAEIGYRKSLNGHLTRAEMEIDHKEANYYIEQARSLGWNPESNEQRDRYINSVRTAK